MVARLPPAAANYSEEERRDFAPSLAVLLEGAAGAPAEQEEEVGVRLLLTEALLLLSATAAMRKLLRDLGVYPCVRESHCVEPSDEVREANESLVGEFYLLGMEPPAEDGSDRRGEAEEPRVVECKGSSDWA